MIYYCNYNSHELIVMKCRYPHFLPRYSYWSIAFTYDTPQVVSSRDDGLIFLYGVKSSYMLNNTNAVSLNPIFTFDKFENDSDNDNDERPNRIMWTATQYISSTDLGIT